MKTFVFCLVLLFPMALFSQDLAEAARAARERAKSSKRPTITNDDAPSASKSSAPGSEWKDALDHMRSVFQDVCADPNTKNGRIFTDEQLRQMNEAAKPLRARLEVSAQKEKELNERFAK